LCEGPEDILRVIQSLPQSQEREREAFGQAPIDQAALDAAAETLRETLFQLLSPTPIAKDTLVRACGAPAPAVYAALVELVLAGRASFVAGGMVAVVMP
jgi:DNA processing protein